ncbi:MAG: hypothetical protein MHPSP_002531 [Paramarteilia canceri]
MCTLEKSGCYIVCSIEYGKRKIKIITMDLKKVVNVNYKKPFHAGFKCIYPIGDNKLRDGALLLTNDKKLYHVFDKGSLRGINPTIVRLKYKGIKYFNSITAIKNSHILLISANKSILMVVKKAHSLEMLYFNLDNRNQYVDFAPTHLSSFIPSDIENRSKIVFSVPRGINFLNENESNQETDTIYSILLNGADSIECFYKYPKSFGQLLNIQASNNDGEFVCLFTTKGLIINEEKQIVYEIDWKKIPNLLEILYSESLDRFYGIDKDSFLIMVDRESTIRKVKLPKVFDKQWLKLNFSNFADVQIFAREYNKTNKSKCGNRSAVYFLKTNK